MGRLIWMAPALLLLAALGISCSEDTTTGGGSRAFQVVERSTLIGGPMALGDLGDFMIENSKIRLVVSKAGLSRAFGLFGGNIVDADRVRGGMGRGTSVGGQGFDTLVEMFPLFFLGAVDPNKVEIVNDGKDGNPASIKVTGEGASFIALTESINNFVTFPNGKNRLHFEVTYALPRGKDYIAITVKVTNKDKAQYVFGGGLRKVIPAITGMVGLFGKRNSVFIPGLAGYNIRFSLQDIFGKNTLKAPAIPGLIGDFVASWGQNGVSYGLVAEPSKDNYVYKNREEFAKLHAPVPVDEGSLIVPMEGSSITVAFGREAPFQLKSNESFEYKMYMVIGDGSVSSIRNAQLEIHKKPKGTVSGRLVQAGTYAPIADAHIFAYTGAAPTNGELVKPGDRLFYTDMRSDAQGNFFGHLEPGKYTLLARNGNNVSAPVTVEVKKDQKIFQQIEMPQLGIVSITVRDQKGRLIPAKVTVLGKVGDYVFQGKKGGCNGKIPIYCLYDPHLGQGKLDTNFNTGLSCDNGTPCTSHAQCKGSGNGLCDYRVNNDTEYREAMFHSTNGLGQFSVRPGVYKIVASRGIEYELSAETGVRVKAGQLVQLNFTLVHSVPTPQAISTDLHVHTNLSHDVSISDRSRVASYAAEGVDTFVATDHNRVRDMQPIVLSLQLERWLKTFVGVELTTFEMGHFNAFPLKLDVNSFSGGNPDWFKQNKRYADDVKFPLSEPARPLKGSRLGVPPAEMFARLRQRGSLCENDRNCPKTIVQVNHPRDAIFGYFNTFALNPDSGIPIYKKVGLFANATQPISREYDVDNYSSKFDAIEIYNGARFDLLWHWKIPPGFKIPAGYGGNTGTIIRTNSKGRALIAFPGGGDDWFNFLNRGLVYTITANSDSHNHDPEAGFPRSYLLTGFDDPQKLTGAMLSDVILKRKVMLTNGPILEVSAKGLGSKFEPIGSTIRANKSFLMNIKVRAATWIDVSEILIYKNGKIVKTIPVTEKTKVERYSRDVELDVSDGDAWFMVVAKGSKGLWPVLRAEEIEPFQIGQAVGLIQDALLGSLPVSLGSGDAACLRPSIVRKVFPYAMTNPIWVDTDGNGFTPNPCKNLGEKGIRCTAQGTTCQDGRCLDPTKKCTSDSDCKQTDQDEYSQCVKGQCTVDPCAKIECASGTGFQSCTDQKPCPNDHCPDADKRCSDGSACKKDGDCKGKGDGLCRYCACPNARKSCPDGKACASDKDCGGAAASCSSRRFCHPTACSLGHCVPTFPTCKLETQDQSAHLFLKMNKPSPKLSPNMSLPGPQVQTQYQRIDLLKLKNLPKDKRPVELDKFSIRNARPYFLYFEHKH